jgi:DNA polymerase III delta prime subunit
MKSTSLLETQLLENQLKINKVLDRDDISREIKTILHSFDEHYKTVTFKKGIYIYGTPGCGKTFFIMNLLKEMNYDIIKYDAGDIRNKSLIDTITSNNISNQNVLNMMTKQKKKIVIVMDEIESMNNGDKGGITSLIKLIRQKKTKKQKLENHTLNPIICIGNYYVDKKIKELMKVCNTFELKTPNLQQTEKIIEISFSKIEKPIKEKIASFIQGDMRKLSFIHNIYQKKPESLTIETMDTIFHVKSFNKDSKKITQMLISSPKKIEEHNQFMNETDRTIVALLWHENIVDHISGYDPKWSFPFYLKILKNICFADYIDRITFQNQIWVFNEMSSLMKTFYNNKLYHESFPKMKPTVEIDRDIVPTEIRFTKVLTKYSTEYNNILFIYNLCIELNMDKKDLISFFQELRLFYRFDFCNNTDKLNEIEKLFEDYNINKLDIRRIYRYLDKNIKKEVASLIEEELEEEVEYL